GADSFNLNDFEGILLSLSNFSPSVVSNPNGRTDIVLLAKDQSALQRIGYVPKTKKFSLLSTIQLSSISSSKVENLVVLAPPSPAYNTDLFLHTRDQFAGDVAVLNSSHPLFFDYYGNFSVGMLANPYSESSPQIESPMLFKPLYNQSSNSLTFKQLANPHSSAFIDLDGDCLAGNTAPESDKFEFSSSGVLPEGTGQISFADIDNSGSMDMIFPVCNSTSCEIHIVYNSQLPFCNTESTYNLPKNSKCRPLDHVCKSDINFGFDLSNPKYHAVIKMEEILPGETLKVEDPNFDGPQPIQIQLEEKQAVVKRRASIFDGVWEKLFGDKDGKKIRGNSRVRLLKNVGDESKSANNLPRRRDFKVLGSGTEMDSGLYLEGNPTKAVFYDMDENGTLDILVSYVDKTGKSRIKLFKNNYHTASSFFLKASVCSYGGYSSHDKNLGYMFGGSFKCVLTSGKKKLVMTGSQLSSTGYRSFQQPFVLFGLGKFNNYINALYIGSTTSFVSTTESLIPNSRLYFLVDRKDNFKPILVLPEAKNPYFILIGLSVTMVILAVSILVLNKFERDSDLAEKQNQLFWINFDAL
ncbi:hypothetical protein BB560_004021, partial [Smittium megazygosporum]